MTALVGVAVGVRILDAEAAVGFERSVVSLRLGLSTGGGAGRPALDRASDAAVGAYNPEEGVLGRTSFDGVFAREGVVMTGGLGVADTRFAAVLGVGTIEVVD